MRVVSELAQQAATQEGLLTSVQLQRNGLSRRQILTLVDHGILHRVHPGVFAILGSSPTWEQQLLAACWSTLPAAVASHRSALRLWGLRSVDEEVEITVRLSRRPRLDGVIVHRSVDLEPCDRTWVGGIPVTSPVRSLCDAGLVFPASEVGRMIRHAVATGLITVPALVQFRERVGRQGRNGVGAVDEALEVLPESAAEAESGPEVAILEICRARRLPMPAVQLPIVAQGRQYRLDLAYPTEKIAIEYDGFAAHTAPEQFARDRQRQNTLVLDGWLVLRFTKEDLRVPGDVAGKIRQALDSVDVSAR